MRPYKTIFLFSSFFVFFINYSHADGIYKTIDKEGKVSYSSHPPPDNTDTVTSQLAIDPDANVIKAEISDEGKIIRQKRKERDQKSREKNARQAKAYGQKVANAQQAVERARQALIDGQITQPGDFVGKKSGGVRPSLQRHNRLASLLKDMELAEENLRQLKKDQKFRTLIKHGSKPEHKPERKPIKQQ